MNDFLQRLKQRKLVQWAIAYVAFAFALIQVLDVAADSYDWPHAEMHLAFGVLALGFVVALVLAWYHGECGVQRISGPELLLIALVLTVGGGLLWHFASVPSKAAAVNAGTPAHSIGSANEHALRNVAGKAVVVPATGASVAMLAASAVTAPPIPAKSVAVLSFENLSADKSNAYFADGMQDLILTKLADIGDLKVISRTSTMQYGSRPESLKRVGKQLGVATILEGSVQKAGKQVLINVQLIDAKTDTHIWAQSYQRTLNNIFGVEGEVAQKVADAMKTKLTDAELHELSHLPTINPQAYTLYLKGVHEIDQFFMGDSNKDRVKRAESYLQQAVAKDPDFALAYALLARTQGDLQFNDIENSPALAHSELANARKAVALQPQLAGPHDDLAVAYGANRMFDKVIPELETSLRLAPNDVRTRHHLAGEYMSRGDWDKAKAIMAPVIQMNPTNVLGYLRVAEIDMDLRQYSKAQLTLDQGLAVAPTSIALASDQAFLFLLLGEPEKALQWSVKLSAADGTRQSIAYPAYMQLSQYAQALASAQSMPEGGNGLALAEKEMMIAAATRLMGSKAHEQTALEKARAAIEPYFRNPHSEVAMAVSHQTEAYATLARIEMLSGHREEAKRAIHKAFSTTESPLYAWSAKVGSLMLTAEVSAHFGDAEAAVDSLRKLLLMQGTGQGISPGLLRLNPAWGPIRKDARFQTLLKKYAKDRPAEATSVAPVAASSEAGHG